jgi:hypothetical protein
MTSVDIETQNQQMEQCEVLTDIGQSVEENVGYSDTEATQGKL